MENMENTSPFYLFSETDISAVDVYPEGDFFLFTPSGMNYHVMPFNSSDCEGIFYFNQVISSIDLNLLSSKIHLAYPTFNSYQADFAYTITWILKKKGLDSKSTLYQVTLVWSGGFGLFMIISYDHMDFLPDQLAFYFDPLLQEYTFQPSVTDSNCNVSGQFIFQLNTVKTEPLLSLI
jgi:hypothetical protein